MRRTALPPQLVGILAMSAAGAVFSCHDAITKYLAETYPIGEIIFFRLISGLFILTATIHFTEGLGVVTSRNIPGQLWRSLFFVVSTVLIAVSVSVLPLPTALAIVFSSPLLIVGGGLNILAHYLTITALRFGDAALVTPFRYTALVWAALLSYSIWGHIPDRYTVVGATIIVAAGVYLVIRESQARRSALAAAAKEAVSDDVR